jgi:hypothetical protein
MKGNFQFPTPDSQRSIAEERVGNWQSGIGSLRARAPKHLVIALLACFGVACRQDMHDAPRYEPLEQSTFFANGQASRQLVANTVARGQLREDDLLYTGRVNGQLSNEFPMPITNEVMARGQERYTVFCAPCHGQTGVGNGFIVQRGFRQPPSYHEQRLVDAPVGYFFDVMTNGFGAMQDYSAQVPVADRWAIAAYLRALQFSRRATVADVPADRRAELDRAPAPQGGAAAPGGVGEAGVTRGAAPQTGSPADPAQQPAPGGSLPQPTPAGQPQPAPPQPAQPAQENQ